MDKTRTHTVDLEPGHFVRADGERTDSLVGAAHYEFRAAIFTNGEASDGDIIDMSTLKIGASMPFFAQHMADPTTQLGTLSGGKVTQRSDSQGSEAVWNGRIDLGGVGDPSKIRIDVAHRMSTGELKRFSGRWGMALDGGTKVTRRVDLTKGHPAYVDASSASEDDIRTHGYYWEGAQAMEGSLVGLGADPGATLRTAAALAFGEKCRAATAKADEADLEAIAPSKQRDVPVTEDDPHLRFVEQIQESMRMMAHQMGDMQTSLGEIQTQLDDLHLADEPERVEGEDPEEPETVEGEPTPLDAQGLRDRLGLKSADTERGDVSDAVNAIVRRAQGKPT